MKDSKIEWTHHTFNPWWGCTKVSPGCTNCYAEALDHRMYAQSGTHWGPGAPRRPASEATWREPLKWNADAAKRGVVERVFCASMADVFDDEAPPGARERLWRLIRETRSNLVWQVLTKRPENIRRMLPDDYSPDIYPNLWLGTTVEDQKRAHERIPKLLAVPAVMHFISCEPLLGPVDLTLVDMEVRGARHQPELHRLDWIIAGGESGHGARPMHPTWARMLRDYAEFHADAAFFFKQWGDWAPANAFPSGTHFSAENGVTWIALDGHHCNGPDNRDHLAEMMFRVGKKNAGRHLDGETYSWFPDAPTPRAVIA